MEYKTIFYEGNIDFHQTIFESFYNYKHYNLQKLYVLDFVGFHK